jgi:hypothetical protein
VLFEYKTKPNQPLIDIANEPLNECYFFEEGYKGLETSMRLLHHKTYIHTLVISI